MNNVTEQQLLRAMALVKATEWFQESLQLGASEELKKIAVKAAQLRHDLCKVIDDLDDGTLMAVRDQRLRELRGGRTEEEWLREKVAIEDQSLTSVGGHMIEHLAKEVTQPIPFVNPAKQ